MVKMVQFFVHNPMLMLIVAGCVLASCSENPHVLSSDKKEKQRVFDTWYAANTDQSIVELKCDFDFHSYPLFKKNSNDAFDANALRGGDRLVVSFDGVEKEDVVIKVEVEEIPVLQCTNHIVPGSDGYMQFHCEQMPLNQNAIRYVINRDLTITSLKNLEMGLDLYATYEVKDGLGILIDVYTFHPRETK